MSDPVASENDLFQKAQMQYLQARVAYLAREVDRLTRENDTLTLRLREYEAPAEVEHGEGMT